MKRMIEIRFRFEGLHHWPDAPDEVIFLRSPHRHEFYARVRMDVLHADRELEFFMMKSRLQQFVKNWGYDLGSQSCEMMATKIMEFVVEKWSRSEVEVEINEDNENGAIVSSSIVQ